MDFDTVLQMAHERFPEGWPDCDRLIFARGRFYPLPLNALEILDEELVQFTITRRDFSIGAPVLTRVAVTTGVVYDRVAAGVRYYTDGGSELYIGAGGVLCSTDGKFLMSSGGPYYLSLPEPGRVVECGGKVFVYSSPTYPLVRPHSPLECVSGEILEYWKVPNVDQIKSDMCVGMFLMKGDEMVRVTGDTVMVDDYRLLTHEEKVKVTTGELLCKS